MSRSKSRDIFDKRDFTPPVGHYKIDTYSAIGTKKNGGIMGKKLKDRSRNNNPAPG